jgi:hypothetical protein
MVVELDPRTPVLETGLFIGDKLLNAAVTIDVVLNIFATTNIIVRLLLH